MEPSDELYETMVKRSARFDGRYYVGIVSTGIVCFPSCRSRLPKRENVCVYSSLEEAVQAGFRPCKRCRPDHPDRHSPDAEIAHGVMGILHTRLEEPLTLTLLAAELNMSPYHLQRIFKRVTGLSPARQLLMIRMDKARRLLAESDQEIGEVAREVGFRSSSHFSVTFKKEAGVSPQAYRIQKGDLRE